MLTTAERTATEGGDGLKRQVQAWQGRPRAAALIRLTARVVPIAASVATTSLASRWLPSAHGLVQVAFWWVVLSAIATLSLYLADRVTRRLLPLAALLKLSLVFPDKAPSRFRSALRTGTVHQLEQRIAEIKERGLSSDQVEAAEQLIELVAALSAHDRLTRGHAERVRAYARMIGEELGLTKADQERLQWAGLLHDVGKLFVPGEILNKPGRLTDEEFEIIKKHPDFGAMLCEPLRGWLGDWVDAVGEHHERWDGKGYPFGKAGEDIALSARIVSVADVFDVITSVRSYKKAMDPVAGREELTRCAGSHFDPRVVRAFLNISLGRLRLVMGPLSSIANLPGVSRVPLVPAMGAALSAAATAFVLAVSGLVHGPAADAAQERDQPPVVAESPPVVPVPTTAVAPVDEREVAAAPPSPPQRRPALRPRAPRTSPTIPAHPALSLRPETFVPVTEGPPAPPPLPVPEPAPPAARPRPLPRPPAPAPLPAPAPAPAPPPAAPLPAPPVNAAPSAVADTASTNEDTPVTINVLANDTDADGDTLTVSAVSATAGVVTTDGTSVTFSPPAQANGDFTVTYTVDDGAGSTGTAQVVIAVAAVNDPPSFTPAASLITVDEDSAPFTGAWAMSPSGGPADEAQAVTFSTSVTNPGLFSAQPSVGADGVLSFVLEHSAFGTTGITVVATDGQGATSQATFTITVTPVQDAPAAADDVYIYDDLVASAGQPMSVAAPGLLGNDGDEDGDPLVLSRVVSGPLGSLTGPAADGSFTYTPPQFFSGTDTFTYEITDGTATSVATVSILVSSAQTGFFLGGGDATSDTWELSTSPFALGADPDNDGFPGFTVASGNQSLTETDPTKFQQWDLAVTSALTLNGPVTLDLWSTVEGFDINDDVDYSGWLLDCDSSGTNCTEIVSSLNVHVDQWNGGTADFVRREIVIGSPSGYTVAAGRRLRLRVMFGHHDVWIDTRAGFESRLLFTQ